MLKLPQSTNTDELLLFAIYLYLFNKCFVNSLGLRILFKFPEGIFNQFDECVDD